MSTYWTSFVLWVDSIPAVIWSGAIGAMIALIGVFFADRSNTKRLRIQLAHDASQKERDRLASLRKDVYLQAPKEAMKALSYLGKLSFRDLSTIGDDDGIAGYAAAAAQIGVISDLPTVAAVGKLGNVMTMELLTAMRELHGVQDTRIDIRLKDQRLQVVFEEVQRIQAEQQAMSESGSRDAHRDRALTYWRDVRIEESEQLRVELNELRARHQRLLFEYHKGFFDRMPIITAQNIQVMREIRKEIGLAHELEQYEVQMNELAADLRTKTLALMEGWATEMEAPR